MYSAHAQADDVNVSDDLYSYPLTYRDLPMGYRENPIQWTSEPRGLREKPIQWTSTPRNHREAPIPQLEEPRNGLEAPRQFVEKDAITVANLNQELKKSTDDHLGNNAWSHFRIPREGFESTGISDNFSSRDPGYAGVNSPSKARLRDFQ